MCNGRRRMFLFPLRRRAGKFSSFMLCRSHDVNRRHILAAWNVGFQKSADAGMHAQTKQENLKRILARFEEKKTKVVGSNRDDRRMKEKEAKLQQKQAQREREQAAQGTKAPVPRPQPEDRGADARKQGLLEKVEKSSFKSGWLNDINDVSRSQAMQVSLHVLYAVWAWEMSHSFLSGVSGPKSHITTLQDRGHRDGQCSRPARCWLRSLRGCPTRATSSCSPSDDHAPCECV